LIFSLPNPVINEPVDSSSLLRCFFKNWFLGYHILSSSHTSLIFLFLGFLCLLFLISLTLVCTPGFRPWASSFDCYSFQITSVAWQLNSYL
jgi:hypothetical protein